MLQVHQGDCRHMDQIQGESVQCVVTSPPYWGLRKYAGQQDLIWGNGHCEHEWISHTQKPKGGLAKLDNMPSIGANKNFEANNRGHETITRFCSKCGAWKGQLGLEPSPQLYVEHLVGIFQEVKRVLRPDGVCFVVIGDSYAGYHGNSKVPDTEAPSNKPGYIENMRQSSVANNLKPKDLCLIPFRLAIALQDNGWWVRSVIIWAKNNPMPESVKDRPTNAHEYILMLTKRQRYYWDQEAVRERFQGKDEREWASAYHEAGSILQGQPNAGIKRTKRYPEGNGRNLRDVWAINTKGFPGAHFAVFPEKIPELCIKAATRPGDTVLDPFMGSGTTLLVAQRLGRNAIGYDISEDYVAMALKRNQQRVLV